MTDQLLGFLAGMITAGYAVAGLFFFRFWRRTGDGLFFAFGAAFELLALNQALLVFLEVPADERSWLFLLRLAAFLLIIVSIWRKNLRAR